MWLGVSRPAIDSRRHQPPLPSFDFFLLLGTAGTGKTHTAKTAIFHTRIVFGDFKVVVIMVSSGVAAANVGE